MSERSCCEITIGGELAAEHVPEFFGILSQYAPPCPCALEESSLHDYMGLYGQIEASCGKARWGGMADLEEFCMKHCLPFLRLPISDAGGEEAWWVPGMVRMEHCLTKGGQVYMREIHLREILDLLNEGKTDDAVAYIEGFLRPLPTVPPFGVKEDSMHTATWE